MTSTQERLEAIEKDLKAMLKTVRKSLKGIRVRASQAVARAEGRHTGRPIKRNDKRILKLRNRGLSIRKIAKLEGISTGSVQLALKSR